MDDAVAEMRYVGVDGAVGELEEVVDLYWRGGGVRGEAKRGERGGSERTWLPRMAMRETAM